MDFLAHSLQSVGGADQAPVSNKEGKDGQPFWDVHFQPSSQFRSGTSVFLDSFLEEGFCRSAIWNMRIARISATTSESIARRGS
jgi:hypothetical protein